jgi:hypothetical protein
MNFQDLLIPLADFMVLTFDMTMPFAEIVNNLCVVVGAVGLVFWLRLQMKYSKQAVQEGGIV